MLRASEERASAVTDKAVARPPSLATWWRLVRMAIASWLDDYAPSMGAALSYYTLFSLAPLLLIVVSVAGLVFGEDAVRGELFAQLQGLMGVDAAQAVQSLLASVYQPVHGVLGTVVGVALLLFGATTVFSELQDALDRIWRAPARAKTSGLWSLLRARLLSFGLILGLAFLLMVSLVFGAVISALGKWWGPLLAGWEMLAQSINVIVGFVLTTAVFALIYKLLPRAQVRWHDVWRGAIVTALLFTVGKFLIGLYIGKSSIASGFGAAGSLVIVLLWVYYSAQIFLVGAEFTWVYARTFGSLCSGAGAAGLAPKAAAADQAPTRSADPAGGAAASVPQAIASAPRAARATSARAPRPLLGDVGAGLAVVLALRFIVPRLLRRL
jgi:membrane protein